MTFSQPLSKGQSLQFAYSTGAYTSIGADFEVLSLAYQRRF